MNRFGEQLRDHWRVNRAAEYQALPDPEMFFTDLGEQVEQTIEELARSKAGPAPDAEQYLDRVQRLATARFEAQNEVMRQQLLNG
jgi:hypothetical protein